MRTGTYKGAKPYGAYARYWPAEVGGRGVEDEQYLFKSRGGGEPWDL